LKLRISLFDIDGVLVQPGGYRAAYYQTVRHFLEMMGLGRFAPIDSVPEMLESFGVTSEWDMVPVTLAIVLDWVFQKQPPDGAFQTFADVTEWVKSFELPDGPVDFEDYINRLGPVLASGGMPSEALLRYMQENGSNGLLPGLAAHPLLKTLFSGSRDLLLSETTRTFQNYVLGDLAFRSAYGMEPLVTVPSCLDRFDRPALNLKSKSFLQKSTFAKQLSIAAYTARPSLPPKEVRGQSGEQTTGSGQYSPEAEMALDLLGLSGIPLIGFGSLQYTAGFLQLTAEDLLKPAPVQALAGIAAAWTGCEWPSLIWAVETYWHEKGAVLPKSVDTEIVLPDEIELNIFEDSPAGIRAGLKAAAILQDSGKDIQVRAWGIAEHPIKVASLQQTGAKVFPDVNAAITEAFCL
jgi:hypothetical protein